MWETSHRKLLCICFLWFTFVCIFTGNMFSIKLYVLVVQYFCQWVNYDNLWKIRTYYEMWKTNLKYKDLFILTSTVSYMRTFTAILNIFFFFKIMSVRNDCPLELLLKRPFVFIQMLSARRFSWKVHGNAAMHCISIFLIFTYFLIFPVW